ncbi:MAG: PD40 domain-containing protein [Planctomycetes bacterium]|nr:PD40 domain-containing protein [Planctomycetota bacterium]
MSARPTIFGIALLGAIAAQFLPRTPDDTEASGPVSHDARGPLRAADFPKKGQYERYLAMLNENGQIPHDALMIAKRERDELVAAPTATGGISPGTWRWHGPTNVAGRMRALYVHPILTETMVLGSASGGIWRTEDGGTNWSVVDDWLPSLAVSSIVAHPSSPGTLYAGTGELFAGDGIPGAGIFKSMDLGKTWSRLATTSTASFTYVNELSISPKNANVLLAATWTSVQRSTDGGLNWTNVMSKRADDVHFDPTGTTAVAFSLDIAPYAFYSLDAGATWSASTGLPKSRRTELAFSSHDPKVVFAGVATDVDKSDVYVSKDSGVTFAKLASSPNPYGEQGFYDNCIWIDPFGKGQRIALGGIGMVTSVNSGSAWAEVTVPHPDIHCIVPHPKYDGNTNKTVFVGTDGGLYRIDDLFESSPKATSLNQDLGTAQFYGGAVTTDGLVIGGMQDNGTYMLRNTIGTQWTYLQPFDGIHCAADPLDRKVYYGTSQYSGVFRILDGGTTPDRMDPPGSGKGNAPYATFITLDPNVSQRLYCGTSELMVCDNTKSAVPPTWRSLTNHGKPKSWVNDVAATPGDSDTVYYTYEYGTLLYKSTNATSANPSWRQLSSSWIRRGIQTIVVSPHDPDTVYVGLAGFSSSNVLVSTDAGLTWRPVDSTTSSPFPRVPVHAIAVHPLTPDWLYVGTEAGLFVSTNGGRDWSTSNEGPANVVVDHLVFRGNRLYAFTHGRGVYSAHADTPEDTDTVVRASVTSFEVEGNAGSFAASIDAEGRRVVFHSDASNLVVADNNGVTDVFVRDLQSGTTEVVSGAPPGKNANGPSRSACIAHEGRFVAFQSQASNLIAGDTNGFEDIFVHDLQDNRTERVPPRDGVTQPTGPSRSPSISPTGRFVAFTSDAANLVIGDTNQLTDVFLHDRARNSTVRMSLNGVSGQANGASDNTSRALSADGRFVTFTSAATNLVSTDTNGARDVFVRDTQTSLTTRVSVDSNGTQGTGDSASSTISADGRFIVFDSAAANLVAGDTNGNRDVFLHDRQTQTTVRVSLTALGGEANGPSFGGVISPDGSHVAFYSSADNLVAGDANKRVDVFVRDLTKNTTTRVSINASNIEANGASALPDIAAAAANVAFQSLADNLVLNDHNQVEDVFATTPRPSIVVWPASRAILDGFSYATRHFAGPSRSQHVFRDVFDEPIQIDGLRMRRDAKFQAQEAIARRVVLEVDCGPADIDKMSDSFATTFVKPPTTVFSRKPISFPDLTTIPQSLPGFRVRVPFDQPFIFDGASDLAFEFRVFSSDSTDDYPIDMHGELASVQTKSLVLGKGCPTKNGTFSFDATYTSTGDNSQLTVKATGAPSSSPLYFMIGAVDPDLALQGLCTKIRTISLLNLFIGVANDQGTLNTELKISPWSASLMGAKLQTQLLTLDLQNQIPLSLSNGLTMTFPTARPGPAARTIFASQVGASNGKLEDLAFTLAIERD